VAFFYRQNPFFFARTWKSNADKPFLFGPIETLHIRRLEGSSKARTYTAEQKPRGVEPSGLQITTVQAVVSARPAQIVNGVSTH
jgi:hypothetical protein